MFKQPKNMQFAGRCRLVLYFTSAFIVSSVHGMPHPLGDLLDNVGVEQAQSGKTGGLIDISPQVGVAANALNSVTKTTEGVAEPDATSALTGLTGGSTGALGGVTGAVDNVLKGVAGSTGLVGGVTNTVGGVTNTVDGLLNQVLDGTLNGVLGGVLGADNLLSQLGILDNLGNIQLQNGSDSLILKLITLNPQLGVAANVLNQINTAQGVTDTGALSGVTGAVGELTNNVGVIQQQTSGSDGAGLRLVTVNPQLSVVANLLNILNQVNNPASAPNCVCEAPKKPAASGSNNFGTIQTQNGSSGSSLINVSPQIGATANVGNTVNQQETPAPAGGVLGGLLNNLGSIQQQNGAAGSDDLRLVAINPQLSIVANLLNILNQVAAQPGAKGSPSGLGNNFGTIQTQNQNANPASLIGVSPQIGATVNALNTINQAAGVVPSGGAPQQNRGTTITGDANTIVKLITVNPQLALVANLLNLLNQAQAASPTCNCNGSPSTPTIPSTPSVPSTSSASSGILNNFGVSQTQNRNTNINGDRNTVAGLIDISPQVGATVNALNTVNQASGPAGEGADCVGDNFGTIQTRNENVDINGNDNTVLKGIDISPQIGVGANILNTVNQGRRCRPTTATPPTTVAPPTVAPPTIAPPTVAPPTIAPPTIAPPTVAPPTVAPPTIAPPTVAPPTIAPPTIAPPTLPPRVCYRRVCQKYRNSPTHPYCHNCPEQLPPYEVIQVDANTVF